ncbi:hypothetical protein EJB05_25807 [Eragrostis curvula]|uniref:Uncharacterized protein n=1 Tax=Eragrostis curvula TaxID=38414 RepID=A0A5J9UJS0_9POAL|nr:hypothetical protein EJB05_25807 [Eragrostis curvula]
MELVRKGAGVLSLAFLMAMVTIVFFSYYAAADYCQVIGPCNWGDCYSFCLQMNYTGDFETFCLPSFSANGHESCCCRVPG